MNEAERRESLVKRLEEITDKFIETFPEKRNKQLARSSRYIHRVKDYLNDAKNRVLDGEITPSFETTLDKIETVIELTSKGSIKAVSGAPLYSKNTASLMKDIAKDIKEEQKAVKKEAKNRYKDPEVKYDQSFVDEVGEVINQMDQEEELYQNENEIENLVETNIFNNDMSLDIYGEIKEIEETIERVKLEIDLIKADDSLEEKQKQQRIKPKKYEIKGLEARLQTLKYDKNVASIIEQARKTQKDINRLSLEIDLIQKDDTLSDEQKVSRIAPKDEELYRLKEKLKKAREVLYKQKEYKEVLNSVTDIPKEEIIRNSKTKLQETLDEIDELTNQRDVLEKEIVLLRHDLYTPGSKFMDEKLKDIIAEKEEMLDDIKEQIKTKRAKYNKNYMSELDKSASTKLQAIQAEIDFLSQDIVLPAVLIKALKTLNPNSKIQYLDYNSIKSDTDINELNLPVGFYIDGNRITNRDTVVGPLYLNMQVKPLLMKKDFKIDESLLEKVASSNQEKSKEADDYVIMSSFEEKNKNIKNEETEEISELIIAVTSLEQVRRNKARTYNEINQIKGNLNKHKEEIKALKTKIKKTNDKKEKEKLKEELDRLVKKYKNKDAKLLETKKIKQVAIDNYDNFIERYEAVKSIIRQLIQYVETTNEIDYDYCLAKQQEIIKLRGENNKYIPESILLEIANELGCEKERVDDETINQIVSLLSEEPPRPEKKGKITSKQAIATIAGVALLGSAPYLGVKVVKSIDDNADKRLELTKQQGENEDKDIPIITDEEINDGGTKADPIHEAAGFEPIVDLSQGVSDGGTTGDPAVEGEVIADTSNYKGEITDAGTTEDPIFSDDLGEPIIEEYTEEELPDDDTIIDEEETELLTQEQIDNFDEEDVIEAFVNKGTTKGGINLNYLSAKDKNALVNRSLDISEEKYDESAGEYAPWKSSVLDVYFDDELYNVDIAPKKS